MHTFFDRKYAMIKNRTISEEEAERILGRTGYDTLDEFISNFTCPESELSVSEYLTSVILKKNLRKKEVISKSGVSENLGYKLLNGTKHTTDRDKIIGLCIGAGLSVAQTNHALTLARLGILYFRSARDAVIMVGLQSGISSVIEMNEHLGKRGYRLLNLHEQKE